jgi:hypothetical protein
MADKASSFVLGGEFVEPPPLDPSLAALTHKYSVAKYETNVRAYTERAIHGLIADLKANPTAYTRMLDAKQGTHGLRQPRYLSHA